LVYRKEGDHLQKWDEKHLAQPTLLALESNLHHEQILQMCEFIQRPYTESNTPIVYVSTKAHACLVLI
jgi:hypothetical protein